jgi:sigma-B regulation protein RsbU (phosphoserine phosphatase)
MPGMPLLPGSAPAMGVMLSPHTAASAGDSGQLYDRSMSVATSEPLDGARPLRAVIAGWLLGLGGAVGAIAVAQGFDRPAAPLAVLAAVVIVGSSLMAGAVAGLAAAGAVATLAWLWLDASEPVPSGYELGLGLGGALLALCVGAALQLRGFSRVRSSWRDRLDLLTEDLADLLTEDPLPALRDAARGATGATLVVIVPPGSGDAPSEMVPDVSVTVSSRTSPPLVVHLQLPSAPPAALAADFTSFLRSVADQCAQALLRCELERSERRASADLELLARASAALSASLDVDEVLATVTDLVVPHLADECSLRIAPRPGQRQRRAEPSGDDDGGTLEVALEAHGALIGELTLRRHGGPLSERDQQAARLLAEPIGRALDHALLFAEQVRTSSTLEHSLLPEAILPVPHLEVATRYLAAAEGHAAGGDFYDVLRTPAGTAVLVVGDVQGKGVEAATLTSTARHTLRAAALAGAGPASMLEQLNAALLYGQSERLVATSGEPSIRFVTAAVVALTPTEHGFRAVVASGGHPPPLVIRPAGTVEQLRIEGVLLGVFADACYQERTVELGLSDIVVLYTDGVTEQRAQPDLFNEAQLGRLVRNMRTAEHVDSEAAAQLILDTVVGLNPREVRDDIALVVARVTGPR